MKLIERLGKEWNDFTWAHPFLCIGGAAILAVNAISYATIATAEGIERLSGSKKQHETLTLVSKEVIPIPNTGDRIPYFVFNSSNGQERAISGAPVVTEGHFFYNWGKDMKEGRKYDVDFFGSKVLGYRLVNYDLTNKKISDQK
jgi:hypothetical protein